MIYILSDIRAYALIRNYCKPLVELYGFRLIILDQNKLNKLITLNTEDFYIFYGAVPDAYIDTSTSSRICVLDADGQTHASRMSDLGIPVIGYTDMPYQFVRVEDSDLTTLLAEPKIYDITIIGEPAKSTIRNELIDKGFSILLMTPDTKDADIARSKIILNLSDTISVLCDRWCLAGHIVISKKSHNRPRSDIDDLIMLEPIECVVGKCSSVLNRYDAYADRQRRILVHGNSTLNRKKHIISSRLTALEKFVDFANSFVRVVPDVEPDVESDIEIVAPAEPDVESIVDRVTEIEPVMSVEQQMYQLTENDRDVQFVLICSKAVGSIASNFVKILQSMNFTTVVREALTAYDTKSDSIYILIHDLAKYEFLPKRYIFYQIEQANSPWFTDKYVEALNRSIMIWEYAIPNTRRYATKENQKKIYYVPMPFYKNANYSDYTNHINHTNHTNYTNHTYDVLFYGAQNARRHKILSHLSKMCEYDNKIKIKIAFGVFGVELQDLIRRSRIVLNLHYYNEPTLETTRLNEVLMHNKLVISEKSIQDDWYNMELYKDCVVFVEPIHDSLINIQQLYDEIGYRLDPEIYQNKIRNIESAIPVLQQRSVFHLHKILTATGLLPNSAPYDLSSPSTADIVCLHLLETPFRMTEFIKQPDMPHTRIQIYPAIKHETGWVGCAMSYQNIMLNAKRCNLPNITVCEDDCRFSRGFDKKYAIIKSFLELYSQWDIFVGCVAALPSDTMFKNIAVYEGMVFIEVNKMHSTVFNIYNSSSYDTICGWDSSNRDVYNQIDQYIKKQNLRIIISYPFEFSCLSTRSTIWEHETVLAYQSMFVQSLELISKKLILYSSNVINTASIRRITYGVSEADATNVTQQMLEYVAAHPLLTEHFDMIRVLGDPYPGSTKALYVYTDKIYKLAANRPYALFVSAPNTADTYNFKKAVRACRKILMKP